MSKHTMEELRMKQALPLDVKVRMTKLRIRQWIDEFGEDGVYVAFSGGKDSTVLLHLVREDYPNVPAVFCDTGLEYPEIREFVKTFDNVTWLRPELTFKQVIERYGYPVISKEVSQRVYDVRTQSARLNVPPHDTYLYKRHFTEDSDYCQKYPLFCSAKWAFLIDSNIKVSHKCCNIMKKNPSKKYEKETGRKPIIGTMAQESRLRQTEWIKSGCNSFEVKRPTSKPMSFWTEQDVLKYIIENNIKIASVYGDIVQVSDYALDGQMDIADFGIAEDVRKCATTGTDRTGCMFCLFGCTGMKWDKLEKMKKTHPKQYDFIMRPKEQGGLNYKEVIDYINEHGNTNIKY